LPDVSFRRNSSRQRDKLREENAEIWWGDFASSGMRGSGEEENQPKPQDPVRKPAKQSHDRRV